MPPKSARPTAHDAAADGFAAVIHALGKTPAVTAGKMFGANALKVNGKVFAMMVKGRFVAKLPATRIAALMREKGATPFDPGHGKPMKEWVALAGHPESWVRLAEEARDFVRSRSP